MELISFALPDDPVNLAERIGRHYMEFGVLILEDKHGECMAAMEHQYHLDAQRINYEVFRKWLSGKGKPVSWDTLVAVLHDIGLKKLSSDIASMKLK